MKIRQLYKCIIDRRDVWDYYDSNIIAPVLTDNKDCGRFITEFIKCSEKSNTELYRNIKELANKSPQRLSHIVSTFFLGLWLFHNKRTSYIRRAITEKLRMLKCFQDNPSEIDRQFSYVWFMASLFHDLGYPAEDSKEGKDLPPNSIPFINSVPKFYCDVYRPYYYKYREKREHGIYAGQIFDKDMCEIRRSKEGTNEMGLSWRVELEDLYHYVAWIIMAHNIWMIRGDDKSIEAYNKAGLNNLILSSEKNEKDLYVDYKVRFEDYPLFTFFCIVDTIEPLKSSSCLSDIDIQLKRGKIIIESNDSVYLRKIKGLNDWLVPTTEGKDTVVINLNM